VVRLIASTEDGSVKVLQYVLYHLKWGYEPNSFEPRSPPRDEVRRDGLRVRTNVQYGKRYPNCHFDLWQPSAEMGGKGPTVIFIRAG
jgi:hypothetical protein